MNPGSFYYLPELTEQQNSRFLIKYVEKGFACIIMPSLILLLFSVR